MPLLSILDLAPIVEGSNAGAALANSIALVRHAEQLGYRRFWVAEHHNMDGIASSATAVVIGQLAAATQTIRVGSGGIMLPNHAPLVIAEQFGTLATFFPGRIDLGLGRAPGTDGPTMRALRRHLDRAGEDRFPEDVIELQSYLAPEREGQVVRAVPGQGTEVPIWLLGSSLYSAQLAAYLGLPFAFASHFAPEQLMQALELYRSHYRPSAQHPKPYSMMGINIIVADTDAEANYLFTSLQQRFLGMQRGKRELLPRPVDSMAGLWTAQEQAGVERMLAESLVGSAATVAAGLRATQARTGVEEFIVACAVHDAQARLRSYQLLAELKLGE
ncbi:LLM class flavin-dependent oxidoreductase [Paucibacter sp. B2R-40]|uniref:LLM class flavin-dependent oxidoreductase n=1 Tax=Paucibacter sp. B2R-40 TaxID=2893554 RepID=UPI0021E43DE0|nr:LLM class flavin-dependent oxidoreductase [Paucibacter sp. B2R-40]MCV2356718.1 LLM class flavin-dependent oxidoreductase [Paucibacter sp. B2R-40]